MTLGLSLVAYLVWHLWRVDRAYRYRRCHPMSQRRRMLGGS